MRKSTAWDLGSQEKTRAERAESESLSQCKAVRSTSQCTRDFFPKKPTGQGWAYCPVDSVAFVACVKPWDQAPAPKKLVAAEHAFNSSTWKGKKQETQVFKGDGGWEFRSSGHPWLRREFKGNQGNWRPCFIFKKKLKRTL